jgi:bifunctional UDP-N-acetylglucosamine pyrophosphorylase/glucosamine-1-phosphate N-acetyltransferase
MSIAVIILAAGKGTRMESDLPKALHEIAHASLLAHAMQAAASLEAEKTVVVVGHEAVAEAAKEIDPDVLIAHQDAQLGTAHAVAQARPALAEFEGDILVLYADTPFISQQTMANIQTARTDADLVILGFEARDPGRYGRLVTDGRKIEEIVEFKDASEEERAINLCNSGVMAASADILFSLIDKIGSENASGEFYLTDCVELANQAGKTASMVKCDEAETLGVNSRADLATAEAAFQNHARRSSIADGVTLLAPDTVFFSFDTVIGRDAVIEQNVVFGPGTTVESGARIRAFCHIEGAHVSRGAIVGPYARLRPGAELAEDVRIGNFVEIKNAQIAQGAKVNHLSYVGDADVGEKANIGAGSVTCNYDGVMKHKTSIGARAFIGSNTMMVAPVRIGDDAMTASGSVITRDVPDEALAVGRADQINKPGFAEKLLNILKKRKQKRNLE